MLSKSYTFLYDEAKARQHLKVASTAMACDRDVESNRAKMIISLEPGNALVQTLTFKPIDIEESFDFCVKFRADAFECSFGSAVDFYGSDNKGIERYHQWLKQKMMDIPGSCVHAWHTDQIVGQIEMGRWRVDPSIGYVNLFYLLPSYRGRGVSSQLNTHAVNFLKRQGFQTARLCVSPTNMRAVRFYEKHGWRDVGVRPDQPNVRYMEKVLEA